MQAILPDLHLAWRLALRAKLLPALVLILVALILTSLLAVQFSGRQPATVALDVGISIMRLSLPILVILLVQELLSREFDRRYFLTSLTYPRPRHLWLFGRVATILLLCLIVLMAMGGIVAALVQYTASNYQQSTPVALGTPYLITLAFIALDLFVIIAMATFLSVVATTNSFVMIGTLGFMVISRSYAGIITLLQSESRLVDSPELYQQSLGLLGYLLPDLGFLDVRMIALYNTWEFLPDSWLVHSFGTLCYASALLSFSVLALRHRRFN